MINKINFNQFFMPIYRTLSLGFLAAIFIAAILYAFLVAFFLLSGSWTMPLVLSPTQEKVLSYQPQVANLQSQLAQQEISLSTFELTFESKTKELKEVKKLLSRQENAQKSEASHLGQMGAALSKITTEKAIDIDRLQKSLAQSEWLLKQLDEEQKAGLLTKYEANREKLSLVSAIASLADARASLIENRNREHQAATASTTFGGSDLSLSALSSIEQEQLLRAKANQLEIELKSAALSVKALKESVQEAKRILSVAQDSPYFKARKGPVTVAFVPYDNLRHVEVGARVYDCYLKVLFCSNVGVVKRIYDAEEYSQHPLFRTLLKGRLIDIEYTDKDASQSSLVFIGGRPLFL